VTGHEIGDGRVWLHAECRRFYTATLAPLGGLRRMRRERLGAPAISAGVDDDLADFK
jgi:hypothetical protein